GYANRRICRRVGCYYFGRGFRIPRWSDSPHYCTQYSRAVQSAAGGVFPPEGIRRHTRRTRTVRLLRSGSIQAGSTTNRTLMAETKVIMPQMGESIFEGTITKWLKKKGDTIQRDEPLFEISTDKIDSEIPAPASGVLQDILVTEGQTVQINTVVAVIGDGSAKPAAEQPPAKEAAKERPKEPPKKEEPREAKGPAPVAGPTPEVEKDEGETADESGIHSSPLVRRIAKEHNVNLSALAGKGTGI